MLNSIKQNLHLLIIFQSLLFMILLCLLSFKKNRANRYLFFFFLFMLCGEVGGLINRFMPSDLCTAFVIVPRIFFILITLSFLAFPFFHLYVLSSTDNSFRLSLRHLIHLIPFSAVLLYVFFEYIVSGSVTTYLISSNNHTVFAFFEYQNIRIARVIQFYSYILLAWYSLYQHKKNITNIFSSVSNISLRWLRFFLVAIALWGLFEIAAILVYRGVLKFYYPYAYILSSVALLIILTTLFLKALSQREIIIPVKLERVGKYKKNPLDEKEKNIYLKMLNEYMLREKPYLEPELTVKNLSDMTEIPPHRISQVLNSALKINFYDYVNSHRIEESKQLLSSDPEDKKNIIEVVYESGFNSKSTFNSVFKKHTGMTPSEYKAAKKEPFMAS
ncbi:MAG: AraC family transcriptional regulator [Spirochaetes bacterium]|nr:AraC family transcriptional regulator [Spirochaetota bacterium]MBN2769582.1 AraC family transcriptional regulator [Spirochaetota bacterium]